MQSFLRKLTSVLALMSLVAVSLILAPAATPATPPSITGTVTGPDGVGLDVVTVEAHAKDTFGKWQYVVENYTDDTGAYELNLPTAGTYRLRFVSEAGSHVVEYWNDAATVLTATDVEVGPAATVSGIDAQLALASHITGKVTIGGVGRELINVAAWRKPEGSDTWLGMSDTFTNAAGEYNLGGLSAGTYVLSTSVGQSRVFWKDATSAETATQIVVGHETTVPGINIDLPAPVAFPWELSPEDKETLAQLRSILQDVAVKGKLKVGRTLRIKGLDADFRTAVSYKLQWYAGAKRIKRATKPTLKLKKSMKGKVVYAKVSASADGMTKSRKIKVGKVK